MASHDASAPAGDTDFLEDCAARYESAVATEKSSTMEMARALWDARQRLAKRGNGVFGKWVSERLGTTRRHAETLSNVWQIFGECEIDFVNFDRTALIRLAPDKVPEYVRESCIRHAEDGNHVSASLAKTCILVAERCPDDVKGVVDEVFERVVAGSSPGRRLADEISTQFGWEPEVKVPESLGDFIASARKRIDELSEVCPDDWREALADVLTEGLNMLRRETDGSLRRAG